MDLYLDFSSNCKKKLYFEYSNSDVDLEEKLSKGIEATNELIKEI